MVRFSYSGTSPATVYSCVRDPFSDGVSTTRKWMSPEVQSAGGKRFVYNKGVVKNIMTLTWNHIEAADLAGILSFLAAVGYGSNAFDFTDPVGNYWTAQFWGPNKLSWVETDVDDRSFSIELLITAKPNLVVNGAAWTGASGATPPTGWTGAYDPIFGVSSGSLSISTTEAPYTPGAYQEITVVSGRKYELRAILSTTSGASAAAISAGTTEAYSGEYGDISNMGSPALSMAMTFTATGTNLFLTIWHFNAPVGGYAYFDNVELYDTGAP